MSLDGGCPLDYEFMVDLRDRELKPAIDFLARRDILRHSVAGTDFGLSTKVFDREEGLKWINVEAKIWEEAGERCWWTEVTVKTPLSTDFTAGMIEAAQSVRYEDGTVVTTELTNKENLQAWFAETFVFYDDPDEIPANAIRTYELLYPDGECVWTITGIDDDEAVIGKDGHHYSTEDNDFIRPDILMLEDELAEQFTLDDWIKAKSILLDLGVPPAEFI